MRVLIYSPLAVLGHHFETELEIAEEHLLKGDEVHMINCSSDLKPLEFTACLGAFRCELCMSRKKEGIALLSHPEKLRQIGLGPIQSVPWASLDNLDNVETIKKLSYKDADLGSAYLSSLISELRDPCPEMENRKEKTKEALDFMAGLYERLNQILTEVRPDRVYFFNGRFCLYRPLLRLCQKNNIEFFVHERGNNNNYYSITKNNMPHDLETSRKLIESQWGNPEKSVDEKISIATEWYDNRAKGMSMAWIAFNNTQQASLLPENWNPKLKNIAIFVSSEDEFEAIPGWELELFPTQSAAIGFICSHFESNPNFKFYIRMHPNLRGLKNRTSEVLSNLDKKYSNCILIPSESPVSSYALMQNADKVVTFGSTVGVEATFWGRPSILLGKAFYQFSYGAERAALIPKTPSDVVEMIATENLLPASKDAAIIFGYWAATLGQPFKFYSPTSFTTGLFKGHLITGNKVYMLLNYFFVALRDVIKIFKGEYGFWHLKEKIKNKLKLFSNGVAK
jgi:hypothetical protein